MIFYFHSLAKAHLPIYIESFAQKYNTITLLLYHL